MTSQTPLIISAPDGYSHLKTPPVLALALLPPSTFLLESSRSQVFHVLNRNGRAYHARVIGRPKVWKTRPEVRIPCKFGFRESFYLTSSDGHTWDPSSPLPYRRLSSSDDRSGA